MQAVLPPVSLQQAREDEAEARAREVQRAADTIGQLSQKIREYEEGGNSQKLQE